MSDEVMPLSDEELAQVKARAEAATKGPWFVTKGAFACPELGRWIVINNQFPDDWYQVRTNSVGYGSESKIDLEFCAHSREDVPRLLATIAARDEEIRELGARISELEGRDITGWQDELYAGDSTDGEEPCEPGEMSDAEEHGRHEPLHQEPFDRFRYR
jgi:hypothetical protein